MAMASAATPDPFRGLWTDQRDLAAQLLSQMQAGARLFELISDEDDRIVDVAQACAQAMGTVLATWDATRPSVTAGQQARASALQLDPRQSLQTLLHGLLDQRAPSLWLVRDIEHFEDPVALRALRRLAQSTHGATVLVHVRRGSSVGQLPETRRHRLPVPGSAQLEHEFRAMAAMRGLDVAAASLVLWSRAALGLPLVQARQAFAQALTEHASSLHASGLHASSLHASSLHAAGLHASGLQDPGRRDAEQGSDSPSHIEQIRPDLGSRRTHVRDPISAALSARKAEALEDSSVLQSLPSVPTASLGGLHHLKAWLSRRAQHLDDDARSAGLAPARGVLLLGVPGCGKSLAAQACADMLARPLLRLDPGRLFGSLLGQSEANLRHALKLAEHVAPAVLWIDEVDKHLGRSEGGSHDGGTGARVMGELLTWLQERRSDVFVVATANRVESLPLEFLRRGRLDEIFFVDVPDATSRQEILRIHLLPHTGGHADVSPPLADPLEAYFAVIDAAEDRTGAEIEAAVKEARWIAYQRKAALAAADLAAALQETIPQAISHAHELEQLRVWARQHARPA